MLEILLARHIDGIPRAVVMGHAAAVHADRYEILAHFQQEVVDANVQIAVVGFVEPALCGATVLFQQPSVGLRVRHGQEGLVDVEHGAYLAVMDALVTLLAFFR